MYSYLAVCCFLRREDDHVFEKNHDIHFTASDEDDAINSIVRWIQNRQSVLPKVFGQPVAIKLYRHTPQPIDADGNLQMATGFPFYDWKYDTGLPMGYVVRAR